MSWQWRPEQWPVWNHEIDRAVRVWAAAGQLDGLTIEEPAGTDELRGELLIERGVGRRHLATVTESLHDKDWRRAHRGAGVYPEDHLWWATAGFLDLDDAIRLLDH